MIAFWMLLGGAAGVRLMQSVWHLLGWGGGGEMSLAVPVGGVAGASAGAVAGKLIRGEAGEVAGQLAGGMLGGITWTTWLFFARAKGPRL